jgi:hypothetical protein
LNGSTFCELLSCSAGLVLLSGLAFSRRHMPWRGGVSPAPPTQVRREALLSSSWLPLPFRVSTAQLILKHKLPWG